MVPAPAPAPAPGTEPPPSSLAPAPVTPPGAEPPAEPETPEEVPAEPVEQTPPVQVVAPPPVLPAGPPPEADLAVKNAPPAPTRTGRGMLIAAGVVGTVGAIVKISSSVGAARNADTQSPVGTLVAGGYLYNPLIGTALGLAIGGMARRGQVDAHAELFENTPATRKRRFRLGWGLFGGGVGLWVITRAAGFLCSTERCTANVWEAGYYGSLMGTIPGAVMGGYASGFRSYEKKFQHLANVSVSPLAHRNGWGVSVSARF